MRGAPPPPVFDPSKGPRKIASAAVSVGRGWTVSGGTAYLGSLDVKWGEAVGFSKAEGGSGGVFFIGFPENKAIVLKGSSSVISDAFASDLAQVVDLPVPQMHLVYYKKGPEFWNLENSLNKLDQLKNECDRGSLHKVIVLPILTLMEFIPALSLDHLTQLHFNSKDWKRKVFIDMGRMLAFDVLINNWDRFPFLWRKDQGNAGNFLFRPENKDKPIVGIDQTVTSIVPSNEASMKSLEMYQSKVKTLFAELGKYTLDIKSLEGLPTILSVFEYLKDNTHEITFEREDWGWLVEGLLLGFWNIIQKINRKLLEEIYKGYETEVEALINRMVWGQDVNGRYGLNNVNMEYLCNMIELFKQYESLFSSKLKELNISY